MLATFSNKLKVVEHRNRTKIRFAHPYRLDISFYIEPRMPNASHPRDWDITLMSKNEALMKQMRADIGRCFVNYVSRRTKGGNVNAMNFKDLMALAEVWSVQ